MSRPFRNCLVPFLILILAFTNTSTLQAARGTPGSPEFGFGALVYANGPLLKEALAMSVDLGLDWISLPVSWKDFQTDAASAPNYAALDPILQVAEQRQIAVMISIADAPLWAQTSQGPDPALTAQFVAGLVKRYPVALQAVELFPGANTSEAWGAPASAPAYLALFKRVSEQLSTQPAQARLVAAGLRPLPAQPAEGDINDLVFLQQMYDLGASSLMPVISLQYADVTGDPLLLPSDQEHRVLRHFEEVRKIMVENHHYSGLIWVTRLSPPSGTISVQDSGYRESNAQALWISQAYLQLRSQLYVGVAFLQSLNSGGEGTAAQVPSLIRAAGDYHPFYPVLSEMIILNKTGDLVVKPGKPKEGYFEKKRP